MSNAASNLTATNLNGSNTVKSKQDFLDFIQRHGPCEEGYDWSAACPGNTAQGVWDAFERPDWMLWVARRAGVPHKTLVQLACVFARSVVQFVPAGELRPLAAIETTEAWIRGEATIEQVRSAESAAWQARYELRNAYAAYAAAAYAAAAADAAADAAAYADAADAEAAYAAAAAAAAYAAARQQTREEIQREFCKVIRKAIPEVPL